MIKLFKKFFKKKEGTSEHKKLLLEKYERGEILQVDGETDNKEYFKCLGEKDGSKEITE